MRLCSIASGSSGNCIYVGSEETHVLVDTGISGKRIEQGLNQLELTGRDIDAILVTHEHSYSFLWIYHLQATFLLNESPMDGTFISNSMHYVENILMLTMDHYADLIPESSQFFGKSCNFLV